jgi:site-specific DNA recombinase
MVVVYERVSTERQDIARQAAQRDLARAEGLEVEVIQDDGVSAYKVPIFDRPGGRRLCELIEADLVAAVYADAQDRLSRGDDVEWVTFRALCEQHGTRIVVDGQELMADLGGNVMGYLRNILARQESEEKSHRVKGGKRLAAQRGRRNGGPRPFGYEQRDGQLTVVPHEVDALRRMAAEVLAGRSYRQIALGLNDDGVRTVKGAEWSQTRVAQVLSNPLYVGKVRHLGDYFDGNHEPIFTPAEWEEVQAASRSRRRGEARGQKQPSEHLFPGGYARCGCCGGSMIPRSTRNQQGRKYRTYRCARNAYGARRCPQPTVRAELIDGAVLSYFERAALDFDATRAAIAEAGVRLLAETRGALDHARHEATRAHERLARVRRDYQDGKLDADEWREHKAELGAERDAASAEVGRLEARMAEVERGADMLDAEGEALAFLADLRAAVAGQVSSAETVAAARQALQMRFDGFTLHRVGALPDEPPPLPDGWIRSRTYTPSELRLVGGWVVEPHPRPDAILDPDKAVEFPLLRRVPLNHAASEGAGVEASRR